jgi:hypothetical protein
MRISNQTLSQYDQVRRDRESAGFVLEPMGEKPECSCIFCDHPVSKSMQRLYDPPTSHMDSLRQQDPDFRGRAAWVCVKHYGAARYHIQTSGVVPTFEQLYDSLSRKAASKTSWSDMPGFKFVVEPGQDPVLWFIKTLDGIPIKVDSTLYTRFKDFVANSTIRVSHKTTRRARFDEWLAENACDHKSQIAFELFLQL